MANAGEGGSIQDQLMTAVFASGMAAPLTSWGGIGKQRRGAWLAQVAPGKDATIARLDSTSIPEEMSGPDKRESVCRLQW
ncbi:hypothetical protein BU23DRAFT_122637 [Bimuria novae-zelandiae CBS 107.79]|uniref:Uncharacterized protein n=1 Tax=Bimuria novae-zelandiae CBS 107.79 TaxID=1447943 RepID=A0A6A5VA37_9PLEO|nr:hypothetical protein BU23DRAFT_122637 [Bimuria novae-zelandiae CBS 107.79]